MGRPQKHTNHPLYKLRVILSGTERAITQPELSRIVDVPLPTLQSIECGRRGWTDEVRSKIRQMIWAVWDETKKRWMFEYSFPPKEFRYQLFEQYRKFISESARIPETDPETIKMRVDALFEHVPKDSWMKLYWRLQDCLEECRQDFELKDLEGLFEAARDQIHFSPATFTATDKASSYTAEPLQRIYAYTHTKRQLQHHLRDYYKRCAKHYGAKAQDTSSPKTWSAVERLDNKKDAS